MIVFIIAVAILIGLLSIAVAVEQHDNQRIDEIETLKTMKGRFR